MALDCKTANLFNFPCDVKTRTLGLIRPSAPPDDSASASSPSADRTDNREFPFRDTLSVDMRREDERLKTFEKWPVTFLRPEELAKSGFYYLGRGDEVRCAFCKVEIIRWEEGDDPAVDHKRWAPQCPLLRRCPTGNVPLERPGGRDECGTRASPPPATDSPGAPSSPSSPAAPGSPHAPGAVRAPGPANPRYGSYPARLRSFKDWPRSMRQKPEDLAEAGFFYTGQGDKTKCFYCDGGLKDWEDDDVPWEQHARWFDRCAFVQLVKGRDYVQRVISEQAVVIPERDGARSPPAPASAASPPAEASAPAPAQPPPAAPAQEPASLDDANLCKICFAEEHNVCFVPCGHVVACAKCALATDKCPLCRRTFMSAVRLYYS